MADNWWKKLWSRRSNREASSANKKKIDPSKISRPILKNPENFGRTDFSATHEPGIQAQFRGPSIADAISQPNSIKEHEFLATLPLRQVDERSSPPGSETPQPNAPHDLSAPQPSWGASPKLPEPSSPPNQEKMVHAFIQEIKRPPPPKLRRMQNRDDLREDFKKPEPRREDTATANDFDARWRNLNLELKAIQGRIDELMRDVEPGGERPDSPTLGEGAARKAAGTNLRAALARGTKRREAKKTDPPITLDNLKLPTAGPPKPTFQRSNKEQRSITNVKDVLASAVARHGKGEETADEIILRRNEERKAFTTSDRGRDRANSI